MKLNIKSALFSILLLIIIVPAFLNAQSYYEGYTLYSVNSSKYTYLIDINKNKVHTWTHTKSGGYSCYLLEDGSVIRPALSSNSSLGGGGEAGVVERWSWDGTLLWQYTFSSSTYRTHHDIEPMPNGNVLLIAWDVLTSTQAVAAGYKSNSSLRLEQILEVQPSGTTGGNIVWRWYAKDHLIQDYNSAKSNYGVVANHPELLDINMTISTSVGVSSGDLMHINGISYNKDLDQIVFSSHTLNEFYVIDHSTTTAQAATHAGGNSGMGGDILYRWGNPSQYDASGTRVFDVVHCSVWVPSGLPGAGNIMAFNNNYSSGKSVIVEVVPPTNGYVYSRTSGSAYGPSSPTWTYSASGFYSNHLGGCQRLPNGNTLIIESTDGRIFEVNSSGTVVWTYSPNAGEIVRALRYAPDYAGVSILDTGSQNSTPAEYTLSQNYPNPFNPSTTIQYDLPEYSYVVLKIYDLTGKEVRTLVDKNQSAGTYNITFDTDNTKIASGMFFYKLIASHADGSTFTQIKKMILMK
jgi:hypothetical protein